MSTSIMTRSSSPEGVGGRTLIGAAAVAGVAFTAEAVASVFVDAHIGYHSLNAVLNAALLVASLRIARAGTTVVGRTGVTGGWGTGVMSLLAMGGGVWAVLVETFTSSESPGVVEGISHTAILASMLFLVLLGIGLHRADPVSGPVIAASSACLVAMVLAGLDQPEVFLVPEVALGLGWVLLSRRLRAGSSHR